MTEQSVPLVKYSPNVRIGNWFEEYCLEEDEIQNFLTKRKKGVLLTQKTRRMFSHLLKEIDLSKMEAHIRFGDAVQLIPTDFKISKDYKKIRPALSLVVTEKTILKSQSIDEGSEVTVAPSVSPCVRNSFIIRSCDAINREGELLKYGQNFVIESIQEGCPKYVLFCSPKSANLSTVFEPTNVALHGGEMNLPVGVCEKVISANTHTIAKLTIHSQQGHTQILHSQCTVSDIKLNCEVKINSAESLPKIPCGHTRWKCQHLNPSLRFEYEGEPVPSNTRLVITHTATNLNLAAENIEFQSFFGNECLVSVHNYIDGLKRVQWQNIWCIRKGDPSEPII